MGRSASCFKILTCSSDNVEKDEYEPLEGKGSSDKRGWSFRKRSARHRVLSNSAASETPSYGNKECPESAADHNQTPVNSDISEKISVLQWPDEKPQLSPLDVKASDAAVSTESEYKVDDNAEIVNKLDSLEAPLAIVIQTAIRGLLAQAALLKLKNLVKLQAAVRGHLVRRHAVGTLRCVQAIVKMQALVRARRTRLSLTGACTEDKVDDRGKTPRSLEKYQYQSKVNVRSASVEKLLSNKFARQLLESKQRTKPIHIKCDPSTPTSAWNWLERWMSVSSSQLAQPEKLELDFDQRKQEKIEDRTEVVAVEETSELKTGGKELSIPVKIKDSLITGNVDKFEHKADLPTSTSARDHLEHPQPENTDHSILNETSVGREVLNPNPQSDGSSKVESNSDSAKPAVDSEQTKRSMKRNASEQLENEGKKFFLGSRKGTSPAFVAAQSKFEKISVPGNSGVSVDSSYQNTEDRTSLEIVSPAPETISRSTESNPLENLAPIVSRVQLHGSECSTEISVTSTLDSPDISESGTLEYEHVAKAPVARVCDKNHMNITEAQDMATNPDSNLPNPLPVPSQSIAGVNGESANSVAVLKEKPESSASDLQLELGPETGRQMYRSSPEGSPRSHISIAESQGTPGSQVSVSANRKKAGKSGSNSKSRSLSGSRKSPSNLDSVARSKTEQLPKDPNNVKRRSSLSSTKSENVDQEPRDSSSGNSLPSYMQPTESARAKAHATNSPRSSPDVQDKEIYMKKRHSLPGANGRQGSPRIQRSMSQAQQAAKGNGAHSPHERKWQR